MARQPASRDAVQRSAQRLSRLFGAGAARNPVPLRYGSRALRSRGPGPAGKERSTLCRGRHSRLLGRAGVVLSARPRLCPERDRDDRRDHPPRHGRPLQAQVRHRGRAGRVLPEAGLPILTHRGDRVGPGGLPGAGHRLRQGLRGPRAARPGLYRHGSRPVHPRAWKRVGVLHLEPGPE